jgi:uncharacterized protein (TIGR02452 family)
MTLKQQNIFEWRIKIWNETRNLSLDFPYSVSKKYVFDEKSTMVKKYDITHVSVMNIDSIVVGKQLKEKGLNPMILNFADDHYAGGAVETGSGAQEESLFRRTNLCATLEQDKFYPILQNEGIYSPVVTVFRDTEDNNNKLLREPWQCAFVAVPGLYCPSVSKSQRLNDHDVTILQKKIELILQIGYMNGHDSLVLGALGCGAWRNPPHHVAELFRDVLKKYDRVFQEIVFPCLSIVPVHGGKSNFEVFTEVLVA